MATEKETAFESVVHRARSLVGKVNDTATDALSAALTALAAVDKTP